MPKQLKIIDLEAHECFTAASLLQRKADDYKAAAENTEGEHAAATRAATLAEANALERTSRVLYGVGHDKRDGRRAIRRTGGDSRVTQPQSISSGEGGADSGSIREGTRPSI